MTPAALPTISLIIPAYNEARYLPRLLDALAGARAHYAGLGGDVEVIVADNASTDATAATARERGARVVPVEKRVIAASRNGGARVAAGEILCFLDADTVSVAPRTFEVVAGLMGSGRYVAGATGVTLERWSFGLAVTYAGMLPLVWLTGLDTGVVFCRRSDYEAVGGYDESRPMGEDVAFLWALRRLGRRRGQRLVRARSVKAVASTRKFDDHGDWHWFAMMPGLAWEMMKGGRTRGLAIERYWYRPDR